jgi:hypothetical protein
MQAFSNKTSSQFFLAGLQQKKTGNWNCFGRRYLHQQVEKK